jgi:aspartate/methionine/tyrosine aminotransferase
LLDPTRDRAADESEPLVTVGAVPNHAAVPPTVPPFHAMAMNLAAERRAAQGLEVIHLEVGQPATGAPAQAVAAVRSALDRPLGYTNAPGMEPLRRRLAERYRDLHDVDVDPARVLIVSGASAGFTLAFLAAFGPGARVAVVEPGYPCYRNTLIALGMEPVPIVVGPETRWAPTPEILDHAGPLDGLVVASPSNPTGTMLDATVLDALARYCDERDMRLVADEIYHGITYAGPAPTLLAATQRAIVVNSFSKYFSMTGWRVGWVVMPDDLAGPIERLQQNLYICAPHVSQVAALGALDATTELDGHVARYGVNRNVLIDGLASAGIDRIAEADGAFYVYADVSHLTADIGIDSFTLCNRWLDDIGVATTPGIDFDLGRGDQFVRFSYAGGRFAIDRACELLAGWRV